MFNELTITRQATPGLYLDGEQLGEILLPNRYIPETFELGDTMNVFVYTDSEDRLVATTETPLAEVDDFAYLQVKEVTHVGAFMEWGLAKDLFVPFREQKYNMEVGHYYAVFIYVDLDSNRIAASSKLDRYVDKFIPTYEEGEEVSILICQRTDIGYKCIVNNSHWGMLYENEVFKPIKMGDRCVAYTKKAREDGKVDLILDRPGYVKVDDHTAHILSLLKGNGGALPITDKSSADDIQRIFGMSKKSFKKAIGKLYKERIIVLEEKGIKLVK